VAAVDWDGLQNDELAVDAARLARAASSAGCGLWELDLTTGAAWVTEETRRIYGLRLAEPFSWEAFVRLLHPEDKDEVVTKLKAVMASGGVFNERHRILLPNGTVRWVHVTARQDGPHRLLGASIDETERVEAERLAKEHESRVLMAAAAAGLGFSEWTTSRGRIYIDARFQEMLGIAPGELDNTYALWLSRIHDEDRSRLADASRRLRSAEADHIVMEYRYLHPQRGETWLRHSACRVPIERSDEVWTIGALEDITARKRHEEHLRQHSEALAQENVTLREEVKRRLTPGQIVGRSAALRRALVLADQVAATDSTVLLVGETGTGKERFAHYVHDCSRRRNRLMIVVNCSAIPTPLLESELFGREKGAYTGALSKQLGRFELAHGSTLFLDEIGELPLEVQVKLLRVIENRTIERLGNPKPIPIDVRIIAATHRDLAAAVRDGKFREDLFYRLSVFPIDVPPLRERRDDIPALVRTFVEELTRSMSKRVGEIDPRSLDALAEHSWPGNVRELRNAVERAMILATGPVLSIEVPRAIGADSTPAPRVAARDQVEQVLHETGWRIRGPHGAAARLGVKPTTLEARIRKLGLARPASRPPVPDPDVSAIDRTRRTKP
jgi:transcriptional regulator with PAS, ATPase and Fis domain